jgi:hypothetical protein
MVGLTYVLQRKDHYNISTPRSCDVLARNTHTVHAFLACTAAWWGTQKPPAPSVFAEPVLAFSSTAGPSASGSCFMFFLAFHTRKSRTLLQFIQQHLESLLARQPHLLRKFSTCYSLFMILLSFFPKNFLIRFQEQ